jgi:hypothetical protein
MSVENMPRIEARNAIVPKARVITWLLAWSLLGLGTGLAAGGCSVSPQTICNLKCSCEGCSEAQLDDCVSDVSATVTKAEGLGCSTQYADWLSCVDEEAECLNGDTFKWDGCEIEEDALSACSGENTCLVAANKLCNECKSSCSEPDPSGCTGRTACVSACIVKTPCDEIINSSASFNECVAACP